MKKTMKYSSRKWYPVTALGWFVTVLYIVLLIYVVLEINFDLYATEKKYFMVSMLFVALITSIMVLAKMRGECPFKKQNV